MYSVYTVYVYCVSILYASYIYIYIVYIYLGHSSVSTSTTYMPCPHKPCHCYIQCLACRLVVRACLRSFCRHFRSTSPVSVTWSHATRNPRWLPIDSPHRPNAVAVDQRSGCAALVTQCACDNYAPIVNPLRYVGSSYCHSMWLHFSLACQMGKRKR